MAQSNDWNGFGNPLEYVVKRAFQVGKANRIILAETTKSNII